jgi:DNA-directed RNA polymerase specialized sigma24 family protein
MAHPMFADDAGLERGAPHAADAAETLRTRERLQGCLEKCIQELDPPNRHMITSYYVGSERVKIDRRRELALSLGVSMNALAIRAFRIRARLERCVRRCESR